MKEEYDAFFDRVVQNKAFVRRNPATAFGVDELPEDDRLRQEFALIRATFRAARITPNYGKLCNHCRSYTGNTRLSMEWFHYEFPAFPVRLTIAKIPWAHRIDIWALLEKFHKLPLLTEYERQLAAHGLDDRQQAVGLVFHAVRRKLVLHNYHRHEDVAVSPWDRGARIMYGGDDVIYRLEPFSRLMAAIGKDWYAMD